MERLHRVDGSGNALTQKSKTAVSKSAYSGTRSTTDSPAADTSSSQPLKTGDVIRHARFGRGVVQYTKGEGSKFQIRVRFDSGRHTTLMVAMAPIEIVKK
jgi:hypothetical protein